MGTFQLPVFQTKEEYAYRLLREGILSGQMAPSERLVMDRLSKEMGISPIPLRGALQRLQTEGLVEITPHSGAVVSAISQDEIGETFQLLEVLEGLAFRHAAGQAGPDDLAALKQLLTEMDTAAQQVQRASEDALDEAIEHWAAANDQFHRKVATLSGMKLLVELTGRTLDQWTRLRRCFRLTLAARVPEAQAEHKHMIELLIQGDGEALAALAAAHNRSARQAYLEPTTTPHPEETQ